MRIKSTINRVCLNKSVSRIEIDHCQGPRISYTYLFGFYRILIDGRYWRNLIQGLRNQGLIFVDTWAYLGLISQDDIRIKDCLCGAGWTVSR